MTKKNLLIPIIICLCINCFSQNLKNNKEFSLLGSGETFKLSPLTDSLIVGGSTALFGLDIYLDKIANYNHVDFNQYNLDINTNPLLDRILMTDYSKGFSLASYGTLGLTGLTSAIFITIPTEEWFTIGTMYAESLLMAFSVKEFGKIMINRPRPYMYYDNYPEEKVTNGDWIQSFPSGHTTAAFTMATFTSYVYCSYFPDSKYRLPLIATSYSLATLTAAFRILSGSHFYSDVLAGAVIGIFCGFTVPYLHTFNINLGSRNAQLTAVPYGFNCCIKY